MNIDYELVGFYQAHPFGACFSQDLVDSMYDYQSNGPDGVVIIYGEPKFFHVGPFVETTGFYWFSSADPVKTRQGQLCLRAYRLSVPALELCAKNDWSPDALVFKFPLFFYRLLASMLSEKQGLFPN